MAATMLHADGSQYAGEAVEISGGERYGRVQVVFRDGHQHAGMCEVELANGGGVDLVPVDLVRPVWHSRAGRVPPHVEFPERCAPYAPVFV